MKKKSEKRSTRENSNVKWRKGDNSKPGTGTVAGVRVIGLSRSHGCRSDLLCDDLQVVTCCRMDKGDAKNDG